MLLPDLLGRLQSLNPPSGAVEKIYGQMLYGAVKSTRPECVLELGTGLGYSTSWMLLALVENEKGDLFTTDLVPTDNPIWKQLNIPTANHLIYLPNETLDSVVLLNILPKKFDLIFHDAGHSWPEVEHDLKNYLPRLKVGGSFIIHDVKYSPAMGDAVLDYFDSRPDEFRYERIEEGCGVGIATRIKEVEVTDTCKDELNGSTTLKATDSSQETTEQTTSRTSQKSKASQAAKVSKKTKVSRLKASKKQKDQELRKSSLLVENVK